MGFPGVAAALVSLILPAGQEPPASRPSAVFRSGLEEVHVALSVRDSRGRVVTDLDVDDFVVKEDGRTQKIQLFARGSEGSGGSGSGAGEEAEAEALAAREALALDLGLLMDTSESMLKELKLSQQAATRFLEAIPRARELYTIFFDEDIRLSRYDSENQQGLFERIHGVKGGGNTALYDAIAVYLSRVQDRSGRKVLVLFTDGEDTKSTLSFGQLADLVRSSRVTIYAIAFGAGSGPRAARARSVLHQLAAMTGGQVFNPTGSRDLPSIYDRILEDLAAQFVIGYVSDNPRRDGKFRKIKVTARRPGVTVRHRSGYTPHEEPPPEE